MGIEEKVLLNDKVEKMDKKEPKYLQWQIWVFKFEKAQINTASNNPVLREIIFPVLTGKWSL